MREKRILFTGAGRRVELVQAFRAAAKALDKALLIYGADLTDNAPALFFCDERRFVPPMKQAGYTDALLAVTKADRIDLLIPTIDTDLPVLAKNKERFLEAGTRVLISAPDKIALCRDKNLTADFFLSCGLRAPRTVRNIRDYDGFFPAFIKPKDGSGSVSAFRARNEEELRVYASQIEDYVIQPCITGTEYTIDIFCDFDGKPVSVVPRERVLVRAGEVLKTKIRMDKKMIREAHRLIEAFEPCGPMTVQLIRDARGEDHFIEINPRYGGGAPLSMKAGAKSAEAVLHLLDGEEPLRYPQISDGAEYHRFDQSVCVAEGIPT